MRSEPALWDAVPRMVSPSPDASCTWSPAADARVRVVDSSAHGSQARLVFVSSYVAEPPFRFVLALSAAMSLDTVPQTLVVRVWAEPDGAIRAAFRTARDVTTMAANRDAALDAFVAWIDQVIEDLR